jgi:hypothetical protein
MKQKRLYIGDIPVDAVLSETHQGDADVTEHPVEKGGAVADHVRAKALTFTVEGIITNVPKDDDDQFDGSGDMERTNEAYARLEKMRANGEVVTVITGVAKYDGMVLTTLSYPRDSKTGDLFKFSATFKQIRIAESKFVRITKRESKIEKGKGKNNLGPQNPKPLTNPKPKSLWLRGSDRVAGWFK